MVVALLDHAAADQLLALDDQVCGDEHDVGREDAHAHVGRRLQLTGIEVVVGEEPAQVLDDLRTAALHRAERVHPVGIRAVDVGELVGRARLETAEQREQCGPDGVLIGLRQRRDIGGVGRGGHCRLLDRVHDSRKGGSMKPPMRPDDMKALVRRHIFDGFNRADWTVCEATLADDRLVESWGVEDTLGWFRQLGKYLEQ